MATIILILITAVLYSAPSRKSTQERSQPTSVKQCGLKTTRREKEQSGPLASDAAQPAGRPFQAVGQATEKARRCRITVRVRGTRNSACAEERNEIRRTSESVERTLLITMKIHLLVNRQKATSFLVYVFPIC